MTEPPFDDYIANANALQMLILRREAAFLYDAVKLYAAALKEMLLNGEDPMNGKALIQKLFKIHYLQGPQKQFISCIFLCRLFPRTNTLWL